MMEHLAFSPLWVFPSLYLVLLARALGQYAAARLLGASYRPFGLPPKGRRGFWSLGIWLLVLPVTRVQGHVFAVPLSRGHRRRNIAVAVASGPAAVLFFGLACGVAFAGGGDAAGLAALPAFFGLLFGVVSLIPIRWFNDESDGFILLALLRGGAQVERLCARIVLELSPEAGLRPRDWDEESVAAVSALADRSVADHIGMLFAYYRALDLDEDAGSVIGAFLERGLNGLANIPDTWRGRVACEAAFVIAYYLHDAERARTVAAVAWPATLVGNARRLRFADYEFYPYKRMTAGLLLAEGKSEEAAALLRSALEGSARPQLSLTRADGSVCERAWLATMLEAIEPAPAKAGPAPAAAPAAEVASQVVESLIARAAAPAGEMLSEPDADRTAVGSAKPRTPSILPPIIVAWCAAGVWYGSASGDSALGWMPGDVLIDGVLGGLLTGSALLMLAAILLLRRGVTVRGLRTLPIACALAIIALPCTLWRFGADGRFVVEFGLLGAWALWSAIAARRPGPAAGGFRWRRGLLLVGVLGPGFVAVAMALGQVHVAIPADAGAAAEASAHHAGEPMVVETRDEGGARFTFRFEGDVSADVRGEVEDAAWVGEGYFKRTFGAGTRQPVTLSVYGGSSYAMTNLGETSGHRIALSTLYSTGASIETLDLRQAVVHELFHVLENELSNGRYRVEGPEWLVEGGAEAAAFAALADNEELAAADARACDILWLFSGDAYSLPLQDISGRLSLRRSARQRYALATLGTQEAVAARGVGALGDYFRRLSGSRWQDAFRGAFGVDADQFYRDFAATRAGFQRPDRDACDFYDDED